MDGDVGVPATSQLIDKLVRRRLVRRSEGTEDRREKAVLLSAKGDSLIKKIARARAARFDASLAVRSAAIARNRLLAGRFVSQPRQVGEAVRD